MIKVIESYQEQKKRHSDELEAFQGIFFAFSDKQFSEGMQSIGLEQSQKDKIFSLGSTGGFILKEKSKPFHDLLEKHSQELQSSIKDERFLLESLVYELCNHEYCITCDTTEALESLGLVKEDVNPAILKKACLVAYNDGRQSSK